jgi:hypothetical protein
MTAADIADVTNDDGDATANGGMGERAMSAAVIKRTHLDATTLHSISYFALYSVSSANWISWESAPIRLPLEDSR